VQRLYAAIDRVVKPIVAAEERRAGAHLLKPGRAVRARDEVGLRQLNDALRTAFDAPGSAGSGRPLARPARHVRRGLRIRPRLHPLPCSSATRWRRVTLAITAADIFAAGVATPP